MTVYFDDKAYQLSELGLLLETTRVSPEATMKLRDWEQSLVYDVLVSTQLKMPTGRGMADMPMEFATKIMGVVLEHGVDSLPPGVRSPKIETLNEHLVHMERLVYKLHSIFHALAKQPNSHFGRWSDNPKAPVDVLCGQAEDMLMEMVPEDRKICALCGNQGGVSEPCEICGVERGKDDD